MLPAIPSWRAVVPLVGTGLFLLLVSVFLIGRDLAFVRDQAEAEIVALSEMGALAIHAFDPHDVRTYLAGLVEHPALATATVYSSTGEQTRQRDSAPREPSFTARLIPALGEPVVGCRAVDQTTLCLEADMGYYQERVAAAVVPHVILLAAAAFLLLVTVLLARGTNRHQIRELARILEAAAAENLYSARAAEGKGDMAELAKAANQLLEQMQQRDLMLRRRTTELESVNQELEAFSYSVSHDLRSPLGSVDGFTEALRESASDRLDESEKEYLKWIQDGIDQMKNLVAGLLQISRVTRSELHRTVVDLSAMAHSIAQSLRQRDPSRPVEFVVQTDLVADADERLLHAVLENLMSNAYKFTGKTADARIEIGVSTEGDRRIYFVKDNGAGFDATQAAKMFTAFQRLHSSSEFEGTGIGLATVKRIIERHSGAIWADGQPGQGATFSFTLGEAPRPLNQAETAELTSV